MKNFRVILEVLLVLMYGVHALMIIGAGIMIFGVVFLAGSLPLLMAAPIGIVVITGLGLGLSLQLRTDKPGQAMWFAVSPLILAPLWYFSISKVIETRCHGWICS
ncbi:MAG: hypothetical protein Q8Q78_05830 [Hydrogenophaga sp.]|nr:hypothetical protein [Hydrogenophaga sp.]